MITTQQAYERGLASGRRATNLRERMDSTYEGWRSTGPLAADVDFAQEVTRLDKQRMESPPPLATFPESRGWTDLMVAERKGFRDGSGADDAGVAFRFTANYFMWTRLYTRYLGKDTTPPVSANCTAVFIRNSAEGGPLYGRNWDETNRPGKDLNVPRYGPDGKRRLWSKGVSCALFCDEEPQQLFPLDAWRVLPEDCSQLDDVVNFLTRYVEFWMPHNGVVVDKDLNCIAFEKTNCRIGWRKSDDGTAAVTACAQVIPEMHAFRDKCLRQSLDVRGLDENSADWVYWKVHEKRYHRLLAMVKEAAANNPTIDDMAAIMTDHALPYPDRICIAGERCHPDIPQGGAEWTMRSRSVVLEGPNARTLFYRVEGDKACYDNPPFLIPGDGVKVKPQWREGTRTAPTPDGPDDVYEVYRRYEFDFPRDYPE